MAYDVKKTDHLFIPFSRFGSALRDSKNNTKIYKDIKTLEQHNKKSHDEPAWLTSNYYVDVVEYAPVVHGRWVKCKDWDYDYECSVCEGYAGEDVDGDHNKLTLYCPNCGAKMMDGDGNG